MTEKEYTDKLDNILSSLPLEFRSYVSYAAWDRGHSAGYENVLGIAEGMAYDLQEPINNFRVRTIAEATACAVKSMLKNKRAD
jgi:hypothetical protein